MNTDRLHFWTVVATTVGAGLMVLLAGMLAATAPTGLARAGYAVVGVANLVAAVVSAFAVRQRLTGRGDIDEGPARMGSSLCILTASLLSSAKTFDEPQWRMLFFWLGVALAAFGVSLPAGCPHPSRPRRRPAE